jgi:hypothetical protein
LLFDSVLSPLPAGVRSTAATARQLLYGVDNYRIDIRLEPTGKFDTATLIGQVLDTANPGSEFAQLPVVLMGRGKPLAESATSRFGEFHLEFRIEGECFLRLRLPDGRGLELPLTGYLADQVTRGIDLTDITGLREVKHGTRKSTRKKV